MKISEIMVREVTTLSENMSAKEGLDLLFKLHISGLPVVNGEGKLVGMFTEKEIMAYLLPSYIEKVGKFIYEQECKSIKKKLSELSKIKVNQLMRRDVVTTFEDVNLSEMARVMLTKKARRIPVIAKDARLIGIVCRYDVLMAMLQEANK